MRIAMLSEEYLPEVGGVSIALHNRLIYLDRLAHECLVFVPDYHILRNTYYADYKKYLGRVFKNVSVDTYPCHVLHQQALQANRFSFTKIRKKILDFKPDIIHVDSPERLTLGFLQLPGSQLAKHLKIPSTAFYHTDYLSYINIYKQQLKWLRIPGMARLLKQLMIYSYNTFDVTITSNQLMEEQLRRQGIRNLISGQYLGIDTHTFKPSAHEKAAGSQIHIVFAGRLAPDKGISFLLKAFSEISKQYPDVKFSIAGVGELEKMVIEYCFQNKNCQFLGKLNHPELAKLFQMTDIFASASCYETFCLTMLEAMACGAAIVTPQSGGQLSFIKDEQNGLYYQPNNVEHFIDQIKTLINNQSLRKKLAVNAIATAKEYSQEIASQNLLNTWETLQKNKSKLPVA